MNARTIETPTERSLPQLCLLICLAGLGLIGGRIAVVRSTTGEVPFLSANDRSRWATVASLVDYRTYRIDHFQRLRDADTGRRTWQSIDRVQHVGPDGKIHDYSSKPPLLATLVAGVYATVKLVSGLGIQQHPFTVARAVLMLVNLPLLAILYTCTSSLILRYAKNLYTVIYLVLCITLGTLLTSFAISLNNHLPAAVASVAALWLLDSQSRYGATVWKMFLGGSVAAFSVANELPSLALLPLWGLISLRLSVSKTLLGFIPGICFIAAGFFATNWLAHQSLRPPYMHRGVGSVVASLDVPPAADKTPLETANQYAPAIAANLGIDAEQIEIVPARNDRWVRANIAERSYALVLSTNSIEIRQWDDWYDYPGTYWQPKKLAGVDRGEASPAKYALHALIGHHGIFSLTPIWLLSLLGVAAWWVERKNMVAEMPSQAKFRSFPVVASAAITLVTLVCLAFYISRPQIDRNYGGVSAGLRWMLWFAPLWIFLAIPAVDWLSKKRWGRALCGCLLIFSVFSVATSLESPWNHPWIYRWMQSISD